MTRFAVLVIERRNLYTVILMCVTCFADVGGKQKPKALPIELPTRYRARALRHRALLFVRLSTHAHTHALLMGHVMAMVTDKKPPASTPYLAQRRDGALSLTIGCATRHWLDPFTRVKSSLLLKIHSASERELKDKTAD